MKRLEDAFGKRILESIQLDGIPQDMASAKALALKKDDLVRKEFEKWAVLTYSNNRAIINEKKGADKGIDGIAYFVIDKDKSEKVMFQVKSGKVNREDVATLRGDMAREQIKVGILITLNEPTKQMRDEAAQAGHYHHELLQKNFDAISIVRIQDIIESAARIQLPVGIEVAKTAEEMGDAHLQNPLL